MDVAALRTLLQDMPGYTPTTPLAEVRAWLRETVSVPSPELVTDRTVMARLTIDEAGTVFSVLDAASASNVVVKRANERLKGDGIDLSHANAQALCDSLFAEPLRSKVKALGARVVPRWTGGYIEDDNFLDAAIAEARR